MSVKTEERKGFLTRLIKLIDDFLRWIVRWFKPRRR
jgi:hypothetical protein